MRPGLLGISLPVQVLRLACTLTSLSPRTLSLHDPGENAYIPAKDAKELREALDSLEDDGGVIE